MKIEDEKGAEWIVQAGDPANQHVLALKRAHVGWVVLPRKVLMTGEIGGRAASTLAPTVDTLRAIRLTDCIEYLQRSTKKGRTNDNEQ